MTLSGPGITNVVVLLTARKVDYLHALIRGLLPREVSLPASERRNLHAGLARAIAGMEPGLFLTARERELGRLDPRSTLDDLEVAPIADALERALHRV